MHSRRIVMTNLNICEDAKNYGVPAMEMLNTAQSALETLQDKLQHKVVLPGDADYDALRMAWNLSFDQHPAVILVAENAEDIMGGLRYARREGLGVAIQATGHGVARPADDCLLIVTSKMVDVQIDAANQTAWVSAGAKWGRVLAAAQSHGLAPLLGSSPDVGAVGYTLGGGLGWLARKFGLAADSVIYFELVTADGHFLRVSPTENPELFWGLRGGGGNFGVITGMKIQLYPVTTVYGGNLIYPISLAKEVLTRYRAWIATAPEELTSSVLIMNYPPLPMVPEPLRGQSVIQVRGCYAGPVEKGAELVQQWRDWMPPMMDMFGEMPFSQVAMISNEPEDPMPGKSTSVWLRELNDETIDILIRYGVTHNGLMVTEVRHIGGAVAKVNTQANAYSNRDASLLLQMVSMAPTSEAGQMAEEYTDQIKDELRPYSMAGVYINFLEGKERRERTQQAYSAETYDRLRALKAQYDPDNLFRYGFRIPPAGAAD